jgi:soluble lytic murein transglycosylase-like protein
MRKTLASRRSPLHSKREPLLHEVRPGIVRYNTDRTLKKAALFLCLASQAFAGEYAVLQNGFRIHVDSHVESQGATGPVVKLVTKQGSEMEMPAANIARYEREEYVPPPPPQPAPVQTVAAQPQQTAPTPKELLNAAAAKAGLRPEFVRSVAVVESALRPNAISPKGAIGLMQLMPQTAATLGVNPTDPMQNAEAGARYLRDLLLKYKDKADPVRLALAAYNAGPGAVDRYHAIPPFHETQAYVEKVLKHYLEQMK